MMDRVHVRGHHDPRDPPLDRSGKTRIGVMKEYRRERERLPRGQGAGPHADDADLRDAPRNRQRELTTMESEPRRCIEIEIDMVSEVKSPQKPDAMNED